MSNKYKLILLDLDGTLLDTSLGLKSSICYAIKECGYPVLSENELNTFIGPPIQESFKRMYGISGNELNKLVQCFRDRYMKYDLLNAKLYDGVVNTLNTLSNSGVLLSVATYKRQDYTDLILKYFEIEKYMFSKCGSDFEGKLTKSNIISKAINLSGISDKSTVLMVGDTKIDCYGAKENAIDFVGVTYGFGYKNQSEILNDGAKKAINSFEELLYIV